MQRIFWLLPALILEGGLLLLMVTIEMCEGDRGPVPPVASSTLYSSYASVAKGILCTYVNGKKKVRKCNQNMVDGATTVTVGESA